MSPVPVVNCWSKTSCRIHWATSEITLKNNGKKRKYKHASRDYYQDLPQQKLVQLLRDQILEENCLKLQEWNDLVFKKINKPIIGTYAGTWK